MPTTHTTARVAKKLRILLMLAPVFCQAADPPADLLRRVAGREAQMEEERTHYTYRQSVKIEEYPDRRGRPGEYREVRDVIFSPTGERTEQFVGKPLSNLARLILTEEDFRDIREIQPFVRSKDQARLYESKYRVEETIDSLACFVLEVKPRHNLQNPLLLDV